MANRVLRGKTLVSGLARSGPTRFTRPLVAMQAVSKSESSHFSSQFPRSGIQPKIEQIRSLTTYNDLFDTNASHDPNKIRTNFLSYVIRALDTCESVRDVKKILDDPKVRMFDLIQVPETYRTLVTCSRVFNTHPNNVHASHYMHAEPRNFTVEYIDNLLDLLLTHPNMHAEPRNFMAEDIDNLLDLLLTHPKTSVHMVHAICEGITEIYSAQSRRDEILDNIFYDLHIGRFVMERAGEFIYHAAMYSEHPTFTIRIILERYQKQHENMDKHMCSLCDTERFNIQALYVQSAHQHALNIGDENTQRLLENNPISANILD